MHSTFAGIPEQRKFYLLNEAIRPAEFDLKLLIVIWAPYRERQPENMANKENGSA